ncbi:MAG: hypothetical protein L0211_18960 [Planctomycetaceae bacterium]|nr:hypothetical protein [Planctomycetaceae bacterium]
MKLTQSAAAWAVAIFLGYASLAWACNVPVFRFALERWRPDPYRVVLLHKGPLSDADRALVQPLVDQQDKGTANLALRTVDVSQLNTDSEEGAADAALFAALSAGQGEPPLPLVVVQYPAHLNIAKPVWAGAPTREAIAGLTESPARKELARRLAEGQTAVWLVLEPAKASESAASGGREHADSSAPAQIRTHREADASRSPEYAAALVEAEIKKLEAELELPELTDAPEDAIAASAPLKIAFSTLRIRRDDPAEQALVAMLIGSEPDLAERTDPLVFPVFGRGRALWPLVGAGITAKNIHDSAGFLVGACSCEVKEQNPGFDLLMATDWDELLSTSGVPLTAVQTKMAAVPTEAELVPIPAGAAAAAWAPVPTQVVVQRSYLQEILRSPKVWIGSGVVLLGLALVVVVVALSQSRGRDVQT